MSRPGHIPPIRIAIVSDANLGNLGSLLKADPGEPALTPVEAPFGQALPTLMNPSAAVWQSKPDAVVVWTTPSGVLPSVSRVLDGHTVADSSLRTEVDAFADAVEASAERTRWTIVPTWLPPFGTRGLGALDLHDPRGLRSLLLEANSSLLERLRDADGCWVLDASAWAAVPAADMTDRRGWYAGKIPFPVPVLQAATRDLKAFLRAATGRARKLIAVDLDNTLWGGVVGETGWAGLRLGGHDPVGEAFVGFQSALKALTRRGVVLAIVSKNEEAVALDAIRNHPEMVLREDDFAGWRINWQDKARNLAELLEELRLGSDAAVFLDDQPAERARVAESLPDVLVPDWPSDPLAMPSALDALACFDLLELSAEDQTRSGSYVAERHRKSLREKIPSMDEWIRQLEVQVRVEVLSQDNLARCAQLLNKTNQMNLATRRMSDRELWDWAEEEGRAFFAVRVADRFGELGLTGLVSLEQDGKDVRIVDFILSCRVMGRRVEEAMVFLASEYGRRAGGTTLHARFRPTERNAPMLAFWRDVSGFSEIGDHTFVRDLADSIPAPEGVRLSGLGEWIEGGTSLVT